MTSLFSLRRGTIASAIALSSLFASACSEPTAVPVGVVNQRGAPDIADIEAAIAAQERHNPMLRAMTGVVGTAVGVLPDGRATIQVFVTHAGIGGVPASLDRIPVSVQVTGLIVARSNPTTRSRPAPLGYSVGHPQITAGTIGARVVDGAGNVLILSNNHVLANINNASIGDATLQPGPFDGGRDPADRIGTLHAFVPINFSGGSNTMDAALAVTSAANVDHATPSDDGYGAPATTIWGDANGDGVFDSRAALLNLAVQKYGRTTKLTKGTITGVNASVSVCYEVFIVWCLRSANFVDQLIITPGAFSDGGDSGSLIVSDGSGRNPVGLLFAGSTSQTIANRIDLVLNHFGVRIDGGGPPPPPPPPPEPLTDVAIASISAPSSVTVGSTVSIGVAVSNVGNQNVGTSLQVTLTDATAGTVIGSAPVASLAAGASTTLNFAWNTSGADLGAHTLVASHDLSDDVTTNDERSRVVDVVSPSVDVHVGDLDGWSRNDGSTWSATVEVTVHGADHAVLNGATVVGRWSISGLASDTCTTGELGGNGTCIFLFPSLRKNTGSVTFTVTSVTISGRTYRPGDNHDPDGSSDGTSITVRKP